ncbi:MULTISPECIES: glycerophosphodiester phosphodiesterase [Streptomyces]|uniref:glycerophosphodiester phosphodiesterase n=1 Tax=Streptomyces TaxID=1883 RepID=UPI0006999039|nr:glycerophosphodiester phosphodiesterase family protein [Streptomyces sp. SID7805]MYU56291.1 glycerophosphodiester phosphodiesterase [Streptomyces sp. SID7805]
MLRRSTRTAAVGVVLLAAAAVPSSAWSSASAFVPGAGARWDAGAGGAPVVIAHRGASRYAPENTLAAVDAAHHHGFLWVENDVQRTRDGQLVVLHDATLERTTDAAKMFPGRAPWRVGDFTAAEIARLDAGSWFGKRFAGERVPTLADYLRRVDRNGQRLLLELKSPEKYPGIEAQTIRELRELGWLDHAHINSRLIVQSFCVRCVRTVHELVPQMRTGILGAPAVSELAHCARFADQINPPISALSSRWIASVHRLRGPHGRPLEIYAWNAAKDASARTAAERGVDGIIV